MVANERIGFKGIRVYKTFFVSIPNIISTIAGSAILAAGVNFTPAAQASGLLKNLSQAGKIIGGLMIGFSLLSILHKIFFSKESEANQFDIPNGYVRCDEYTTPPEEFPPALLKLFGSKEKIRSIPCLEGRIDLYIAKDYAECIVDDQPIEDGNNEAVQSIKTQFGKKPIVRGTSTENTFFIAIRFTEVYRGETRYDYYIIEEETELFCPILTLVKCGRKKREENAYHSYSLKYMEPSLRISKDKISSYLFGDGKGIFADWLRKFICNEPCYRLGLNVPGGFVEDMEYSIRRV